MTRTHHHSHGRHAKPDPAPSVPTLPLSPDQPPEPEEVSLGELVREATQHFSTLFRAEVELAKAEVTAEVRKGVKGSVYFVVALAILVFSLFFFFLALSELLAEWLPRWSAFGLVFVLMLISAGLFALSGWGRVRSIRKPERTISTVRETGAALTHRASYHRADAGHADGGPYADGGPHVDGSHRAGGGPRHRTAAERPEV